MNLFDETVKKYLTDNTTASAGVAASGGQGGGDYEAGDTYAPVDARMPKVLGKIIKRKKKKKKKKLNEAKSIYDYLLFPPESDEHKKIVANIAKLQNSPEEAYRGISSAEYKNLNKHGFVVSRGVGNTRKGITGSYVSDDIQLAGRFAFHEYKQKGRGYILVLNRDKLPELNPADEGNYWTAKIPLDAVKQAINLQDLAK